MKNLFVPLFVLALLSLLVASTACTSTSRQRRASVLEYLYPEGAEALPAQDVQLELPLAIGLAFVPEAKAWDNALLPAQQETLLGRVRTAFAGTPEFERIEVVPTSFVYPAGGFDNVEQIRRSLGLDIIVLVSFDQTQFDDPNMASLTYWTLIGAYVIPANVNETHTFVNATAFDIASRALLLNAQGQSVVEGKSTPMDLERSLREDRFDGFELAVEDLIGKLDGALAQFREQVKTGTVRGQGTPAVKITTAGGATGGGAGLGSMGLLELGLGLSLLALLRRAERRA